MQTYDEARAQLPAHARWTASFGNPGCGGYAEYWKDDASGQRYIIDNGETVPGQIYGEIDWRAAPCGIGGYQLGGGAGWPCDYGNPELWSGLFFPFGDTAHLITLAFACWSIA